MSSAQDCCGITTSLVGFLSCLHETESCVHGILGLVSIEDLNGLGNCLNLCEATLLPLGKVCVSLCAHLSQVCQELLILGKCCLSLSKVLLCFSIVHISLGKFILFSLGHLLATLNLRCLCCAELRKRGCTYCLCLLCLRQTSFHFILQLLQHAKDLTTRRRIRRHVLAA